MDIEPIVASGLSRRDLLKLGGLSALALAGGTALSVIGSNPASAAVQTRRFASTDGFVRLPGRADDLYVFGFTEVSTSATVAWLSNPANGVKGAVTWPAPFMAVPEYTLGSPIDQKLRLTNVGLQLRPDLDDSHTVHWHGFRNPLPFYDGTPEMSISVPVGRNFTYFYRPRDPGTYMYHCHFEDVEHVQMGMDGLVWITPAQNGNTALYPSGKYVYNDGDGSTGYDREFGLLLNEVDTRPHDNLLAVQEFIWVDYDPNYWVINGRAYPDTIKPHAHASIPSQTLSALVQANAGEQILLRIANLGYEQHAMRLAGISMRVVGHDATLLTAAEQYQTDTIYIGPGESREVIFTAPAHAGGNPDAYLFANRNLAYLTNDGHTAPNGIGGMATEVHVFAPGTLAAQSSANQLF